jgi:hypothetical protein
MAKTAEKPSSTRAIVPVAPTVADDLVREIESLSSEQIRSELARSLAHTAAHFLRSAMLVKVLEDRGEDLSDLRIGLLGYLRRIACGQVLPEVVVRFAEYPLLIQRVSVLPLQDQQKLAAGEPVLLSVFGPDGAITRRMVDPIRMTREQIVQVFAKDRIRSEGEQALLLEDRRLRPAPKAKSLGRVRADRERGGLVLGRTFVETAEVVCALAELAGEDDDAPRDKSLLVKLSEAEHAALWKTAGPTKSMSELARNAMRAAGLI